MRGIGQGNRHARTTRNAATAFSDGLNFFRITRQVISAEKSASPQLCRLRTKDGELRTDDHELPQRVTSTGYDRIASSITLIFQGLDVVPDCGTHEKQEKKCPNEPILKASLQRRCLAPIGVSRSRLALASPHRL
jgi:hypothetical protein